MTFWPRFRLARSLLINSRVLLIFCLSIFFSLFSCFIFHFPFFFSLLIFPPIIGHVKVAARSLISYHIYIYTYMFVRVSLNSLCLCASVCMCMSVCIPHTHERARRQSMYSLHVNTTMNHPHEFSRSIRIRLCLSHLLQHDSIPKKSILSSFLR